MNACEKGKRGERLWRDELIAMGFDARRGQQHAGGTDSPDVICPDLPRIHFEVKMGSDRYIGLGTKLDEAMEQAIRDGVGKVPVVAWKQDRRPWCLSWLTASEGVLATTTSRYRMLAVLKQLNERTTP